MNFQTNDGQKVALIYAEKLRDTETLCIRHFEYFDANMSITRSSSRVFDLTECIDKTRLTIVRL